MPCRFIYRPVRFRIPLLASVPRRGAALYPSPVAYIAPGTLNGSSHLCSRSGPSDPSRSSLVAIRRCETCLDRTPDAFRSPSAAIFYDCHRRINVPGSLRPAWLTVPWTSWNLHHPAPNRFRSQTENGVPGRFSAVFSRCETNGLWQTGVENLWIKQGIDVLF
jgi:hypothetical protein